MCYKRVATVVVYENTRYTDAINAGRRVNPYSAFVQSCENFLYNRGYLTDAQVHKLYNLQPPYPKRSCYCSDHHYGY